MAALNLNGVPVSGTASKRIARALINGYLQLDKLAKRAQLKQETLVRHLKTMELQGMGVTIEGNTVVLRAVKPDWIEFIRTCELRLKDYPDKCPDRAKIVAQINRLRREHSCPTK